MGFGNAVDIGQYASSKEKDRIIQALRNENGQLKNFLKGRQTYESFLAHALGGCLSNAEMLSHGSTPEEQMDIASKMAMGSARRLCDILAEVEQKEYEVMMKKHEEEMAKEAVAAEAEKPQTPVEPGGPKPLITV